MTPIEKARQLISEWLSSGSADGPSAYTDDANELLFILADEGLTVVSADALAAYRTVRASL